MTEVAERGTASAAVSVLSRIPAGLPCVLTVLAVTTYLRFTLAARFPLWMDETWTAMIAAQPTLSDFLRQSYGDTNAPLYYVVAALSAKVFGFSNFALRLPAVVFGALAPVVALNMRLPKTVRYTWTVLLACWIPGIWYSENARCYTLLILFSVMNCGAFIGAWEDAGRKAFARWAVISSLMVLTHYYAGLLVALQGLALLWRHRSLAMLWPGFLAFIPAAASLAVSASKFLLFTDDSVSWIPLVNGMRAYHLFSSLLGGFLVTPIVGLWLVGCLAAGGLLIALKRSLPAKPETPLTIWMTAGLAVASVAIALAVGVFKPVVYQNYLVAFAPGVLLGLSALAGHLIISPAAASAALAATFAGATLVWSVSPPVGVRHLNIETASNYLMQYKPKRLVFLWDSPFMLNLARANGNHSALEGVGGFFFKRAGQPIPVDVVDVRPNEDPNPVLLARAAADGSAIIWVYDFYIQGTAAKRHPPRISQMDPRFECQVSIHRYIHILACHK